MSIPLRKLAELVQGDLQGDGDLVIRRARGLHDAQAGDLTLLESEKYLPQLLKSPAAAVVAGFDVPLSDRSVLRVADPLMAFVAIVRHLRGEAKGTRSGVHPQAAVEPDAVVGPDPAVDAFVRIGSGTTIGARCRLHAHVSIGNDCRLGDDVVLHPGVVLYDGTVLGDRVIVHANSVLGADGFGYRFRQGRHDKVPQLGHVEVEDDVEIGACTTIDRGTFGPTRIGCGTKIDNLVQVGHNCRIGSHNLLVSQMGIAGSSTTGDYVVIAGQVGITDHVHIGEGTIIGAKAGVTKDVPPGQRMLGAPATPERDQKRILMSLLKLPEFRHEIQKIKQHLGMKDEGKDAA